VLGVSDALDVDGIRRGGDLVQILGAQLEVGGAEVLLQAVQLARPGDRGDPRFLGEQPRKGDVGRGGWNR